MSVIYSLPGHDKHGKFDKMLFKAAQSSAATTLGWGDTSMAESLDVDLQVVTWG